MTVRDEPSAAEQRFIEPLANLMRKSVDGDVRTDVEAGSRERFLIAAGKPIRRSPSIRLILSAAAIAAIVLVIALVAWPRRLEYALSGPAVNAGGWLEIAAQGPPAELDFNE